jgi:hypothetical protein
VAVIDWSDCVCTLPVELRKRIGGQQLILLLEFALSPRPDTQTASKPLSLLSACSVTLCSRLHRPNILSISPHPSRFFPISNPRHSPLSTRARRGKTHDSSEHHTRSPRASTAQRHPFSLSNCPIPARPLSCLLAYLSPSHRSLPSCISPRFPPSNPSTSPHRSSPRTTGGARRRRNGRKGML